MTRRTALSPEIARTASGPRSRLALLWLVLAVVFQGFATQTHAHFGSERGAAVVSATHIVAQTVDGDRPSPVTPPCQLCEEKALFGAYLLAGPATLVTPQPIIYRYAAATLPSFARGTSSHSWQSRAPPLPIV